MRRDDPLLIPLYFWVSASILLHILSYFGTTGVAAHARADLLAANARHAGSDDGTSEVEFTYVPAPPVAQNPDVDETPAARTERQQHEAAQRRAEVTRRQLEHVRVPVPVPTRPTAVAPPQVRRPPAERHLQMVDQQRADDQARPDDPAFLAQSNNDVREQTQAQVRNLNRDDPSPQMGGTPTQGHGDQAGNGEHSISADDRDVAGDRNRVPTASPHPQQRPPAATETASRDRARSGAEVARAQEPGHTGAANAPGAPGTQGANQETPSPGDAPSVMTAYHGNTSISIASTAHGAAGQGDDGRNGQNGRNGDGGRDQTPADRLGIRGAGPGGTMVALQPNDTTYGEVFGAEAEHERVVAQQRRSQARGNYTDSWRANRAAIENYIPSVRVGNQTALRTAQSPFAGYVTAMHRRIHRLFADGYLADLSSLPSNNPLNDPSLVTTLEIVLERDGRIHRLGVVRTSGNMAFDVGALNSVRHAAPFGSAPAAILSGDARVYLHWGFHRNEMQCGPYNAEPYILPNPGGEPGPGPTRPGRSPRDEHPPIPAGSTLGSGPSRRAVPTA